MEKKTIAGIAIIACVALCTSVWPRSDEVGGLPAEPVKTAVTAEFESQSEEISEILFSADAFALGTQPIAESEPPKTVRTAEEETKKPAPTQTAQQVKPSPSTSEPHNGNVRVVEGERQVYLLGFGWIKDEGGGSVGTVAADMYENGNKIGIIRSGTTVGNPGDELTGNKVGIMGSTTVHGKGDINKQIGIMGGEECPSSTPTSPLTEQPELTGDVIYVPLQPPVTKNSTPPPYKPNGEPYNP